MSGVANSIDVPLKAGLNGLDTPLSSAIGLRVRTAGDSVINKSLNQEVSECILEFTAPIRDYFCTSPIARQDPMQEMVSNLRGTLILKREYLYILREVLDADQKVCMTSV